MSDDLLDEILANPRHIALRLVYADQLLERGDPRGELIQLECTPGPMSPERRARRDVLVKQFETVWKTETGLEVTLDRGFVSNVRGNTDLIVAHAARIAREPVRELRVFPIGDLAAFAALPELAPIEKLVFYRRADVAGVAALATSTTLTSLRSLSLMANQFSEGAVWAAQLRHLTVYAIGDRDAFPGVDYGFTELTSVELVGCRVGARAGDLAQRMPRLQSLKLAHNGIGPVGARALAAVRLPRLSNLELLYEDIEIPGAWAIGEANGWPALRRLSLQWNKLGDAGIAALVASPLCANLVELELSYNDLGDGAVRLIADSPHLTTLRVLGIANRDVSHDALRRLLERRPGLRLVGMKLS